VKNKRPVEKEKVKSKRGSKETPFCLGFACLEVCLRESSALYYLYYPALFLLYSYRNEKLSQDRRTRFDSKQAGYEIEKQVIGPMLHSLL
jgi:hypothetical protein